MTGGHSPFFQAHAAGLTAQYINFFNNSVLQPRDWFIALFFEKYQFRYKNSREKFYKIRTSYIYLRLRESRRLELPCTQ